MNRLIPFLRWLGSAFRQAGRRAGPSGGDLDSLRELFDRLGCPDPEGWARSQLEEGINQLGRFVFIRQAWAEAVPFDSTDWIDNVLRNCPADTPSGAAWRHLLNSGADRRELAMIVREAQAEIIFGICRLLDGPDDLPDQIPGFGWGLFETDAAGQPMSRISFLHESVSELDPARAWQFGGAPNG